MFSGILPIGSVVKLKNVEIKVMVVGYLPVSQDENAEEHEYSGIIYPLGYQHEDEIIQFDAVDVCGIEYLGLQDREQMSFEEYLISKMDEDESDEDENDGEEQ